ncbi:MAG: M1 family metallopeptidase [Clostridiales bacterium]|nr:M1 family metallopeptidase [Clostridiales bacterium]
MKKKLVFIMLILVLIISLFACKDKMDQKNSHIDYNITITGQNNVYTVEQSTTIKNVYKDDLDHLIFNLYANAYREDAENKAYTAKLTSYGQIDIESVSVDGQNCKYELEQDNSILNVAIPALAINKSICVVMAYQVTLPECNIRMGVSGDCTKLANFYPQLAVYENDSFRCDVYTTIGDPFYSNTANYEVTITAPQDSVIASSGVLQKSTETPDGIENKYIAKDIRDFVIVIDKNLLVEKGNIGDTEVLYYYYEDQDPQATLKYALDAMSIFNDKYGAYPYPTLSIVMTDFESAGMEYGCLVYVALDTMNIEDTIVHEIAHQWWYGIVGSDSINHAFLDEGLACFSTLYYYKQIYGQEKFDDSLKAISDSYTLYERIQKMRKTEEDLSINRSIYDLTQYQYEMLAYRKSTMMFAHLMQTMGEAKFNKALSNYVKNNRYKIANANALISELNKAYGSDIGGLVKGWLGNGARVTMMSN